MKNYAVTISVPAVGDVVVEAASKDAAIEKARAMLVEGKDISFMWDVCSEEAPSIYAAEMQDGENDLSGLRYFIVTMEATSYKEVPVRAVSEAAALELVHDMYFTTDTLDFNDSDVTDVIVSTKEDRDEELDALITLVQSIRESDKPDKTLAEMLRRKLSTVFGKTE